MHWGGPVSGINILLTTIILRNILYSHKIPKVFDVERRELVPPLGIRVLFICAILVPFGKSISVSSDPNKMYFLEISLSNPIKMNFL